MMPEAKKGDRVIVIRNSDDEKVYAYGAGTYEGRCIVTEEDIKVAPEKMRAMLRLLESCKLRNQRYMLDDNRGVVWGCHCWWGPLDLLDKICNGRELVIVAINNEQGDERWKQANR